MAIWQIVPSRSISPGISAKQLFHCRSGLYESYSSRPIIFEISQPETLKLKNIELLNFEILSFHIFNSIFL